jgi:hypothetical protein
VETNLGTSQVKVKGNFDPDMLVKYIYKHTGKHAFIVKQEQVSFSIFFISAIKILILIYKLC